MSWPRFWVSWSTGFSVAAMAWSLGLDGWHAAAFVVSASFLWGMVAAMYGGKR